MSADSALYASERVARAYAFTRPPVHPHLIDRLVRHLPGGRPVARALDIGCGAGCSSAALAPVARQVVGMDPYRTMLAHRAVVAPEAGFCVARAEALPFAPGTFDLVTAAGSLNYADVTCSLTEISRVLCAGGLFAPCDFSAGRRIHGDGRLERWHADFMARFPSPAGYALDLPTMSYAAHGLELHSFEAFEVEIPMSRAAYVDYLMGEAGVEMAFRGGVDPAQVRRFCEDGLAEVFAPGPRPIVIEAQVAVARKR